MNVAQLLFAAASRFGGNDAIVHRNGRVSYSQLVQAVGATSRLLRELGVEPGDRVALLMTNSPGYVSAYYGVLAAGAVAVPLNSASRAEELARTIAHSGSRLLIADGHHSQLATLGTLTQGLHVQSMDASRADWAGRGADSSQPVECEADAAATILYTSGTTGAPKGVTLSHGNIDSNVRAITDYLGLTADDSIVTVLPFHYSYGNSVLQTHMAVGAKLVIENGMHYPAKVLGLMESERVTGFSGVPSTYALLISRCRPQEYRLDSLRYMTQAGGAMTPALTRQVLSAFSRSDLFVMYGQTEATARLTYLPPRQLQKKLGSVGIPVDGVHIDIRDDAGNSLPAGQAGEVWVSGRNIMQGYWRDPERTAEVISRGWLSRI